MNAPRSGCPINLTLEALGDRWSLIVIRDLMFGNGRHFRELLTRSEERIASNILRPEAVVRVHGGTAAPPPGGAGAQGVGLLQAAVGLRSRHW